MFWKKREENKRKIIKTFAKHKEIRYNESLNVEGEETYVSCCCLR